jgi:hypothetical protein
MRFSHHHRLSMTIEAKFRVSVESNQSNAFAINRTKTDLKIFRSQIGQ